MTTVVVMRHGQTTWNRDRRIQGWAPTRLTAAGREQAAAAGAWLAEEYDLDRVVASDLRRVEETVDRVCDHVDAPVAFEAAWRERDFGVYQGLTYEKMFDRHPAFALGEASAEAAERVPEGGESLLQVRERVLDRWAELLAESDDDETVLVVSHGGPIYLLLGHVKGLDVADAVLDHVQDNCAVTELRAGGDETVVSRENCTDWRA